MASEITYNLTFKSSKSGLRSDHIITKSIDQTTAGVVQRLQTVPTSDTVVTLTGITTPKVIVIENTDATNYIDIGATVTGAIAPLARLQPGEWVSFPAYPSVVVRAQAHTASVVIKITIQEA